MRKPYMTKKRKREFYLTYQLIDEIQASIYNLEIDMETFKKYGAMDEYATRLERKKHYEGRLQDFKKQGWEID